MAPMRRSLILTMFAVPPKICECQNIIINAAFYLEMLRTYISLEALFPAETVEPPAPAAAAKLRHPALAHLLCELLHHIELL